MSALRWTLILLTCAIVCCAPVQARSTATSTKVTLEPSSPAQETVGRVVTLFINWKGNQLSPSFTNQVAQYIDYNLMSSLVLGNDYWAKLSPAQQQSFITAFRRLIEQRYYIRWHKIFKHGKLSFTGETHSTDQIVVKTEIAVKDEQTVVNWKLRSVQGSYKVVSLTTDHRDLLEILRPRFDKVFSQRGFNGLMSWLNHKATTSSH